MIPARPLAAARVITAAAFLDLFMQFPTVAPYAVMLGAPPAMVGMIIALYSASNLVGNVGAGVWLDRWGQRRPLLIGLGVTGATVAAYSVVATPGLLAALRLVHGLSASVLAVGAFALMGDAARPERRAWVMGQGGALIGAAAVAGPPLAGVLRDRFGFEAVFLAVATLMVIAAAVVWRSIPEAGAMERPRITEPPSLAGIRRFLTTRALAAAYAAVFAYTIGLGVVVTDLPLALQAAGRSGAAIGAAFGAFALFAVVVMLSPVTRSSDRRGRRTPLVAGLALVAIGLTVMARGPEAAIPGMAVFGIGFGFVFPSAGALVAESVTPAERGRAFGVFYALWSLGTVAGAALAGGLAQWIGTASGWPFLAAALPALLGVPAVCVLLPPPHSAPPHIAR